MLHRVRVALEGVTRLDLIAHLRVLLLELLRLLHHALDVLLPQAALVVGDRDLLRLARALVLRAHVQDAVRVDFKRDLDLRHAARRWR